MKRAAGVIALGILIAGTLVLGSANSAVGDNSRFVSHPAVYRDGTWYLRNSLTTGFADTSFVYGNPGTDVPLMCDFFGTGLQTPVVFRAPNKWLYRNSNTSGVADGHFKFGEAGDIPMCANIDGVTDGRADDEPIVVRNGEWFWRDGPTTGAAQHQIRFGSPGDFPIMGSWQGVGYAPGVVRPGPIWYGGLSFFYPDGGPTVFTYPYGIPGDSPVAGEWRAGDFTSGPGVVRGNEWLLHYINQPGYADIDFFFGDQGDVPLVWHDHRE